MKKLVTFCLAAFIALPAYSVFADQGKVSTSIKNSQGTFLVAANDEAELQPAESEKKMEASEESPEEEKKESKAGFFAGVALMIVFIIIILAKTKKMTDE